MSARRWAVTLVAVGVVGAQWSLAVKWPRRSVSGEDLVAFGVGLVVYETVLLLALLAGVGLEHRTRRPLPPTDVGLPDGGAERRPHRTFAVAAAVAMVVFGALSVRFAVTDRSAPRRAQDGIVAVAGCGSPIDPVDYDCAQHFPWASRRVRGDADSAATAVFLTGAASLLFGGWTMSALRLRRLRLPPGVVGVVVTAGVALLGAVVVAMPGAYPSPTASGAPGGYGDDFQGWAFAQVLGDLHAAGVLLVAAVALLAPLAASRWTRGVALPIPAALVGVALAGLAGIVVMATMLVPMLSYIMAGP